jgi:hypothetical protein
MLRTALEELGSRADRLTAAGATLRVRSLAAVPPRCPRAASPARGLRFSCTRTRAGVRLAGIGPRPGLGG